MKRQVKVVIGANFGDEGKGLMTDYFANKGDKSVVVRFNGGGQAGHTVVTPDGREHVFSNIGSATMAGVPTYLSKYFLVNPILFNMEYAVLKNTLYGINSAIYVDNNAILSTPYDMMINQAVEMLRGDSRHGSCGLGISETVVRSEWNNGKLLLKASDLWDLPVLRGKLEAIRDLYVPLRLMQHGIDGADKLPEQFKAITGDGLINSYLSDCAMFVDRVVFSNPSVLSEFSTIVFEGAQGLLLDQDLTEYSPHITHSSTGLKNVLGVLEDVRFEYELEVTYVTRTYLTRHGAGPLPYEIDRLPYSKVVDTTNIPNQWQGSLRFGVLDLGLIRNRVLSDMKTTEGTGANYSLAVTCLDQVDATIKFMLDGEEFNEDPDTFFGVIALEFPGLSCVYNSHGRTRETINKRKIL